MAVQQYGQSALVITWVLRWVGNAHAEALNTHGVKVGFNTCEDLLQ